MINDISPRQSKCTKTEQPQVQEDIHIQSTGPYSHHSGHTHVHASSGHEERHEEEREDAHHDEEDEE